MKCSLKLKFLHRHRKTLTSVPRFRLWNIYWYHFHCYFNSAHGSTIGTAVIKYSATVLALTALRWLWFEATASLYALVFIALAVKTATCQQAPLSVNLKDCSISFWGGESRKNIGFGRLEEAGNSKHLRFRLLWGKTNLNVTILWFRMSRKMFFHLDFLIFCRVHPNLRCILCAATVPLCSLNCLWCEADLPRLPFFPLAALTQCETHNLLSGGSSYLKEAHLCFANCIFRSASHSVQLEWHIPKCVLCPCHHTVTPLKLLTTLIKMENLVSGFETSPGGLCVGLPLQRYALL